MGDSTVGRRAEWLRRHGLRVEVGSGTFALAAAIWWTVSADRRFVAAWAPLGANASEAIGFAWVVLAVVSAHVLLLALLGGERLLKPIVAVLTIVNALAAHFGDRYGVVVDPSMLRNVWRTDVAEAVELLSPALAWHLLLWGVVPVLLLTRVTIRRRKWPWALTERAVTAIAALVVGGGALLAAFQPMSARLRLEPSLRYRLLPEAALWSMAATLRREARAATVTRRPIGIDAVPGASWASRRRPMVLVLVVGETARAANWGLAGYARQTTPELAQRNVIDFGPVEACGTDTETSVPCLFAPIGRRQYDEARIRQEESLLHLLARAGVSVHWRDNQSGCKGVCDGLPNDTVSALGLPDHCPGGRCVDEGLVADLGKRLASARGTHVWVLHMLGNHGPSYFRRHPAGEAPYQPECQEDDLRRCSSQEIVNAYDNALRYTDRVLAMAIDTLREHASEVDSALLFVSDHGESLGEYGLYLHGAPRAIAPAVQRQVPMTLWLGDGFPAATGLDRACLQSGMRPAGGAPVAHDHVFHTVLGLLDVRTAVHEPQWDLTSSCRTGAVVAGN